MGRFVRFSITVRLDQYEKLRLVENRSQLLRNLIDAHFDGQKAEGSLEERLAGLETKLNSVEQLITPLAGKRAEPAA
ncbi:MAG: hypothetical protein QW057_04280 [Candidatus Bathyarchaeia archaeon]